MCSKCQETEAERYTVRERQREDALVCNKCQKTETERYKDRERQREDALVCNKCQERERSKYQRQIKGDRDRQSEINYMGGGGGGGVMEHERGRGRGEGGGDKTTRFKQEKSIERKAKRQMKPRGSGHINCFKVNVMTV